MLFLSGIAGGFLEVLEGHPGYLVIHLFDKGFKRYIGPNNVSFFHMLSTSEARLGGRVRHFHPADHGDGWYDRHGILHPPPISPLNVGNLLWEVQANCTRAHVTAHRWTAEANFARDWANKMTGGRDEIPQQLLEPYRKQPTPQVPKIFVVNAASHQLVHDFGTPVSEVYELPHNVTYADIGRQMAIRIDLMNWLDPLRTGLPSPFHRANIFAKPTQVQLRQARNVAGTCNRFSTFINLIFIQRCIF